MGITRIAGNTTARENSSGGQGCRISRMLRLLFRQIEDNDVYRQNSHRNDGNHCHRDKEHGDTALSVVRIVIAPGHIHTPMLILQSAPVGCCDVLHSTLECEFVLLHSDVIRGVNAQTSHSSAVGPPI